MVQITVYVHMKYFNCENSLATANLLAKLYPTSQASWWSMPGTDYDLAIYFPGMRAAYENQA